MIDDYYAFSATEVGYNHTKSGKVCEDASDFYDDDRMHLCVVADGHGSDNYPRTDKGSRMAVDSAIKCAVDFVKAADVNDVLSDEKYGFPMLLQLTKSILKDWHESVKKDYQSNPFTEAELKAVSEKYRRRYLSKDVTKRYVEKAYGTTLILFVVTAEYSFGLQIGDGKCVFIDDNGEFLEPIPWDENCQLNVTTSICDNDSLDEFRFFVTKEPPAAVFCGSDGIDDSYSNPEELHALYRSILKIFSEHGSDVGKNEIKEYLPILTKKGSGDDVSLGLIYNLKKVRRLRHKFEIQASLFSLHVDLNQKRQQLNTNIEKDKALAARIIRWANSGKKSGNSDKLDARSLDELRETKEVIEKEISGIEIRIQELERTLHEEINEWSDYLPEDEEAQSEEVISDDMNNESETDTEPNKEYAHSGDEQKTVQSIDEASAGSINEDFEDQSRDVEKNLDTDNISEKDRVNSDEDQEKPQTIHEDYPEYIDDRTGVVINVAEEEKAEADTDDNCSVPNKKHEENELTADPLLGNGYESLDVDTADEESQYSENETVEEQNCVELEGKLEETPLITTKSEEKESQTENESFVEETKAEDQGITDDNCSNLPGQQEELIIELDVGEEHTGHNELKEEAEASDKKKENSTDA